MKRALFADDGMPVLLGHRPKYSLRSYPLLRSDGSVHHVAQEARVGGDAIRLLKNTLSHHSRKSASASALAWSVLSQATG